MIITNAYKYFQTSLFDPSEEIEITEKEFLEFVNYFRKTLEPEWGITYKKYWLLDDGIKTEHYLVKRLDGIEYNEE